MRKILLAADIVGLLLAGCVLTAGCAQNTEVPGDQRMAQVTETPTVTAQDAETRGSEVYVTFSNGPEKRKTPTATTMPAEKRSEFLAAFGVTLTPEEEKAVEDAGVVYVQCNNTVTITTGGTTPSQAGTTTGTASAAQTPSMTQTASPTQHVEPDTGVTANLGIAPGGIVDQQGAATGGSGSTSAEKTSENILTRIEAVESALEKLSGLIQAVMEQVKSMAASRPAS